MTRMPEGKHDDLAAFSEEFQEFLKFVLLRREGMIIPSEKDIVPYVDIFSRKGEVVIEVELAGIDRQNIEVTFVNPFVFITGAKESRLKETKVNYICMECAFGDFQRIIEVPYTVNSSMAKAAFRNGLLTITLPIVDNRRTKRKKIPIA